MGSMIHRCIDRNTRGCYICSEYLLCIGQPDTDLRIAQQKSNFLKRSSQLQNRMEASEEGGGVNSEYSVLCMIAR